VRFGYLCLVAVFLAQPLGANAQQRHSGSARAEGTSSTAQSTQQPQQQQPAQRANAWNGQRQNEWWEHQAPPSWERKVPANGIYDIRQIPGWTQGNVAKAMLEQERARQQRADQIRHGQVRPRSHNYQPSVVYVLPAYGYGGASVSSIYETAAPAQPAPVAVPEPPPAYEARVPLGALRLEVEPRESLQVFVDGVFIGTPADLGDDIEMTTGPHRVELRARGHKTQSIDVGIVEDKMITYRGALERDAAAAPAAPVARPSGSKTMYVIPGCYMGNVSPKEMSLPAGCDISKLTTISPQ
jgi:hypothetical protein